MATYTLKGPQQQTKPAVREWLVMRKLQHLKSHHHSDIKVGDAIKSPLGFIAKVISINGREITISNRKLSKIELRNSF